MILGAGRTKTEDPIDAAVGVSGIVKIGDRVEQGQPLATIHANAETKWQEASSLIEKAFEISEVARPSPPLITETILTANGLGAV